jgi:hypothetical protein
MIALEIVWYVENRTKSRPTCPPTRIWLFLGEVPFLSAAGKSKEDELG